MNSQPFDWIPLYQELAGALLLYRDDRAALIEKLGAVYAPIDVDMPKKLDSVFPPADIDPFTFFGVFNKGISDNNRTAILGSMKREFGLSSEVPASFVGIPSLNNLNATFYRFTGDPARGSGDIDDLWSAFSAALAYADVPTASNRSEFCEAFDAVRGLKGNRWKLTMGLYWIRPFSYLNLDSRSRWFIDQKSCLPRDIAGRVGDLSEVPPAREYLEICERVQAECDGGEHEFSSFPELSYVAWRVSEEVNEEKRASEASDRAKAANADPILSDEGARNPELIKQPTVLFSDEDPDMMGGDSRADDGSLEPSNPAYGKDDFLDDVFVGEREYDTLAVLVARKKNVILEGAPGTGKTYCAKRLAYALMGERDASRVCMVQFHQSYAYEDFIEGFRPTAAGFELRKGVFYDFCKLAEEDGDRDYFFIIDEINRGNLSKILGELFMLIEADKRGVKLRLLYSDEHFCVPANVFIIGTMNTADRSIAMMDFALRRRFAFFNLKPGFDTDSFNTYRRGLGSSAFDALVTCVKDLNAEIADDESLGTGFVIGHSYLCGFDPETATPEALQRVVDFELAPLLHEYWFDDLEKADRWTARLRSSVE